MSPIEAYQYMVKTGEPMVAEKIPHWAKNDPGAAEWLKHQYRFIGGSIEESYESSTIKTWKLNDWLTWWLNFCYNTNSAFHNVELIPYEKRT